MLALVLRAQQSAETKPYYSPDLQLSDTKTTDRGVKIEASWNIDDPCGALQVPSCRKPV